MTGAPVRRARPSQDADEKAAGEKALLLFRLRAAEREALMGTPRAPPPEPEMVDFQGHQVPAALGDCADLLYELKAEKARAAAVVAEIERGARILQEYVIATLPKSSSTGVAGRIARVQVVTKEVPQAKDWPALYGYISTTQAFELLHKRLSESAIKERWDAGEIIPGVGTFTTVSLSITKL